jgi:hypothetical protein
MPNFRQGPYTVKNTAKYVGNGTPKYRSGWELTFMMFLDSNDNEETTAVSPKKM